MLWHVQPWPLLSCAHSCHYQHCHRAPLAAPPQWLLALTPMLFWVTPATFPVLSPVGAGSCLLHNSWGSAGSKHPPKGLLLPVWTAGCRGLESEGLPRPPGALGHLGCGCGVAQRGTSCLPDPGFKFKRSERSPGAEWQSRSFG